MNYFALICLVCFDDDTLPFFSRYKALMLSWNMMHLSTVYPWHSTKYLIHITSLSLSCRAIISVSVEIFVLLFCSFEELDTASAPKVTRRLSPDNLRVFGETHRCTNELRNSSHLLPKLTWGIVSRLGTSELSWVFPSHLQQGLALA